MRQFDNEIEKRQLGNDKHFFFSWSQVAQSFKDSPTNFILTTLFSLIILGFAIPDAHGPISIGVGGLAALGLYQLIINKNHTSKSSATKRNWVILLPALYFFAIVFSGINSENKNSWLDWVRLTLPFLLVPIAFYGIPPLSKEPFKKLLSVFIGIMSVSLFFVLVWFGLHFEEISANLLRGQPIPTPHSHIRFSLLLVMAFFCSIWLRKTSRWWWLIAFYLFIGIHILSVRSALMSLYVGILFFAVRFLFTEQKVLGLVIVVNTFVLLAVAYTHVPSLQNRLNFMKYDFEQWQAGNIEGNSDGMRLASIQSGWELWRDNFWTGVGVGDIKQASAQTVQANYPSISDEKNLKMPHNQFLWTACASGVFGLVALLFVFFFPIWHFRHEMDWLFLAMQLLFFTAFMVEYMLEAQVGGTFYILFQSLFYSYYSGVQMGEKNEED